jgi:WhiB family redox-sensing transcriptional regulator
VIEFRRLPRAFELAGESGGFRFPPRDHLRLPVAKPVDDGWRADAACTGMDVNLWFLPRSVHPAQALEVCAGCPVREQCLDAALLEEGTASPHGVRGGLTAAQRMRLGRQRRRGLVADGLAG